MNTQTEGRCESDDTREGRSLFRPTSAQERGSEQHRDDPARQQQLVLKRLRQQERRLDAMKSTISGRDFLR